MKKIICMILAVMVIAAMAIPAYAVTPSFGVPDMPEIPNIADDVAERVRGWIPTDFWDRWFANHPLPIFNLPSKELTDRLSGLFG